MANSVFLCALLLVLAFLTQSNCVEDYDCTNPVPSYKKDVWRTPTVITTFNIKFLINPELGQGPFANNETGTELHLDVIAKEISELDSDIVQVQEVGDCSIFKKLADRVAKYNKQLVYEDYLVKTPDATTNQSTGLLTKYTPSKPVYRSSVSTHYPVPKSTCPIKYEGDTETTKHNIAIFEGDFEKQFGFKLALIGLLFQTMDSGCVIREAEATNIKKITRDLVKKGYEVIIQGDINDLSNKFGDINNAKGLGQASSIIEDGKPKLTNEDETIP